MDLHHFDRSAEPAEVVAHLRQWGYAIVDDAADADTMDRLDAEAIPYIEASDVGQDQYDGRFTRRTGALIARCPTAHELVMHPTVVAVATGFLDHASAVQLHLTQIISIEPGETAQKLHRDEMAFALGYVGDQVDPLAALRDESTKKQTIAEHGATSDGHRRFADEVNG